MTSRTIRLSLSLVCAGILCAAAVPAAAGTVVSCTFSNPNLGANSFQGVFTYDDTQPVTMLHPGLFQFQSSSKNHTLQYAIGTGGQVAYQSGNMYNVVLTNPLNGQFVLKADMGGGVTATVTLQFPAKFANLNFLPNCSAFPTMPPFGTFVLSTGFSQQISSLAPCVMVDSAAPRCQPLLCAHGVWPDCRWLAAPGPLGHLLWPEETGALRVARVGGCGRVIRGPSSAGGAVETQGPAGPCLAGTPRAGRAVCVPMRA